MNANVGISALRVNDYMGGVSGGESGNQLPSAAAMDFNTADKKGQVLEVRDGGHGATAFESKKSHFSCVWWCMCMCVYVCVSEGQMLA